MARDAEIARRIRARQVQAAHLSQAADAKALQLAAHLVPQRVQRARLIDPPEAQTRLKLMVDARGATLCVQAICDWLGLVHLRQARVNERQAPIGEGTQNQVAKVNVVKDNYVAWMRLPARVVVDVPGDRIEQRDACGCSETIRTKLVNFTGQGRRRGWMRGEAANARTLPVFEGIPLVLVELGQADQRAGDAVRIANERTLCKWIRPAKVAVQTLPLEARQLGEIALDRA